MRATCQIICYVFTLLIILFLGGVFDTAFRQAGIQAKIRLPGMPLPIITEFLIKHHRLPRPILLFPWLVFVGLPVKSQSTAHAYWEAANFFLRLLAFLIVESWILLLFIFAIIRPFVPYYGVMEMRGDTPVELVGSLVCWGIASLLVAGATFRFIRRRSHP